MPRVKRGTKRRARRKKILERASGYYLTKSKLYRSGQGVGRARAEVRLQRPQTEEASVPLHLDCARRRRRQAERPQLQQVHQRPEEGRHRVGPQDPCRSGGQRSGWVYGAVQAGASRHGIVRPSQQQSSDFRWAARVAARCASGSPEGETNVAQDVSPG